MASKKRKSKRRSNGRSAGRPKKFTAYLDAAVGCSEVKEAFNANKIKYKLHTSFYRPSTPDKEWLPRVGREGWVLITTDDSMQYRGAEKAAIMAYKVRSFVFKPRMDGRGIARFLVRMMPAMRRFCGLHGRPFIGSLLESGTIRLILDNRGIVSGPRTL